jgi:hypothetical protein
MPIDPAHLARSLGALDTLDVQRGFTATLQQVLRSAKTLLDADMAGLMLVDHAGVMHWVSTSDRVVAAVAGDLSAPVQVGGGPVGTLEIYVTAPREWDDSQVAALQTYAGLVASLLAAAVTARVRGRLADQLQGALEHRLLIEQAEAVLIDREGLDAQAAFEWLRTAARSSACSSGVRGSWNCPSSVTTTPGSLAMAKKRSARPRALGGEHRTYDWNHVSSSRP